MKGGLTRLNGSWRAPRRSAPASAMRQRASSSRARSGVGSRQRTYDHLRDRFPGRAIVVFGRETSRCVPPDDLVGSDFAGRSANLPDPVAVIHADISASIDKKCAMGRGLYSRALAPGGFLIGDQPMDDRAGASRALNILGWHCCLDACSRCRKPNDRSA
jgi:hypothetical protein